MNGILQVERFGECGEVIGVSVHVIAAPGLGGAAVAAAVVGDAAIAVTREKKHLVFESVGIEWPAVAENNGLSGSPVFVIQINVGSVFFADCYVGHKSYLLFFSANCWLDAEVKLNGAEFADSSQKTRLLKT